MGTHAYAHSTTQQQKLSAVMNWSTFNCRVKEQCQWNMKPKSKKNHVKWTHATTKITLFQRNHQLESITRKQTGSHLWLWCCALALLDLSALDRRRTDHIILTLDLWPWPSIPCELWSWPMYSIHTHTHTQSFNGLFSTTTWVGRYQKDKPFWIFWSRDDGVAVASAGPYVSHLHFAPDR